MMSLGQHCMVNRLVLMMMGFESQISLLGVELILAL